MDNLEIGKAAQQLRSGESLIWQGRALAPLLSILNSALEGEMDAHLSEGTPAHVMVRSVRSKQNLSHYRDSS